MEINNIFWRLVKATKNLLLTPNVPRSSVLSFAELNTDIILEIFSFYVSSQTDGAFILTLISTLWRDFVLQSPILWQWITVDEQSPDWIEKAHLCATLSGAHPLQIVLRLPMVEFKPLYSLLPRCQNLFFEIPDYMTVRDVRQETERLFNGLNGPHSCKLHHHRTGEYLIQEAREAISADLSTMQKLELAADGSEQPNYHRYAQTRDLRVLERGDNYHPLLLLKVYRLLDILRNASNLRTLIISHHSMDPIFSDLDLPIVNLVNLEELQIMHIDYKRNGSLLPFAESIQCSNLSTLGLSGYYEDIMDVMERLGEISRPSNLGFRFRYNHRDVPRAPSFRLPSVSHISVQFEGAIYDIHQWKLDLERGVGTAMHIANTATVLRATLPSRTIDLGDAAFIECVRHVFHVQCRCYCYWSTGLNLPMRTNLTEIDIRVLPAITFLNRSIPVYIATGMSFPLLTTISCSPNVLVPLLSQHRMPMLNTIQLHVPRDASMDDDVILAELRYFDEKITEWVIRHADADLPLRIHTLGLSWFPKWRTLLPMLYHMARNLGDGRDLTIKLPACPHHEILKPLKLALAGVDDGTDLFASSRPHMDENSGVKG